MKFIDLHFNKIVLGLLIVMFLKQCTTSSRVASLEKQAKIANSRLDSLITRDELKKAVTVEGLKSEKRMIQSTDRKILDVNRQSEIDKELQKLEAK